MASQVISVSSPEQGHKRDAKLAQQTQGHNAIAAEKPRYVFRPLSKMYNFIYRHGQIIDFLCFRNTFEIWDVYLYESQRFLAVDTKEM